MNKMNKLEIQVGIIGLLIPFTIPLGIICNWLFILTFILTFYFLYLINRETPIREDKYEHCRIFD